MKTLFSLNLFPPSSVLIQFAAYSGIRPIFLLGSEMCSVLKDDPSCTTLRSLGFWLRDGNEVWYAMMGHLPFQGIVEAYAVRQNWTITIARAISRAERFTTIGFEAIKAAKLNMTGLAAKHFLLRAICFANTSSKSIVLGIQWLVSFALILTSTFWFLCPYSPSIIRFVLQDHFFANICTSFVQF